jgi:Tfp pilus assembly protein PilV
MGVSLARKARHFFAGQQAGVGLIEVLVTLLIFIYIIVGVRRYANALIAV